MLPSILTNQFKDYFIIYVGIFFCMFLVFLFNDLMDYFRHSQYKLSCIATRQKENLLLLCLLSLLDYIA